jgi:hypothetical protein
MRIVMDHQPEHPINWCAEQNSAPPNAPLPALRTAGMTHRETQLAKCPAAYTS